MFLHFVTCCVSVFKISHDSFLTLSDNFIQVDIFYQELSCEVIRQNKAFEFLSLLSEIGGFLGLLLGASVLTVCELLDYVLLNVFQRFNKKKQVKNVDTADEPHEGTGTDKDVQFDTKTTHR